MSFPPDKRKQSIYVPEDMLTQIQFEAVRQERSFSAMIQMAWKIAYPTIQQHPTSPAVLPAPKVTK